MHPLTVSISASLLLAVLTLWAQEGGSVLGNRVGREQWGGGQAGDEQGKAPQMQPQKPTDVKFISIHNFASPKSQEATRVKSNQDGHKARGFGDIAYHYIVGDSGRIYDGRRPTLAPASNTYYLDAEELKTKVTAVNEGKIQLDAAFREWTQSRIPGHTKGHLTVSFMCGGIVRNGELVDHPELLQPQAMQRAAILIAELLVQHGLDPKDIRAHRELAETNCPNDEIYRWLRGSTMNAGGEGPGMKMIQAEFKRLTGGGR